MSIPPAGKFAGHHPISSVDITLIYRFICDCHDIILCTQSAWHKWPDGCKMESSGLEESSPDYGYHLVDLKGLKIPNIFSKAISEVENIHCTENDIFVATFPKSGTTWMQAIVTMILDERGSRALDPAVFDLYRDWLLLEGTSLSLTDAPLAAANATKDPRKFKSHLPFHLLPISAIQNEAKIIHVYRNPKDVIVSYYHYSKYHRLLKRCHPVESLEHFAEAFMNDNVARAPYFRHLESYWNRRDDANLLTVSYENLMTEPVEYITEIAAFLGKKLSKEQLDDIIMHSSFEKMSLNAELSHQKIGLDLYDKDANGVVMYEFMRSGKIGDWKSHFSPALNARVDAWINQKLSEHNLDRKMFFGLD